MAVKRYNGTAWEVKAGDQNITYNATAPAAPATGDVWVSTADIVSFDNTVQTGNRNAIINGDFRIWQRGTSFNDPVDNGYTADRWSIWSNVPGDTRIISQQAFTPGNVIPGHESPFFLRFAQTVAGSGGDYSTIVQRIEDVRTFAGQTISISFWAKADATRTVSTSFGQIFGSGGSGTVFTTASTHTITTSWQRFTSTFNVPSIAGKTLGANSCLEFAFVLPLNAVQTFDFWGVQVEKGSTATPFETRPIGLELSLCQRYFWRHAPTSISYLSFVYAGTQYRLTLPLPVEMRVVPTSVTVSSWSGGTVPSAFNANKQSINWYSAAGNYYIDNGNIIDISAEL